MYPKFKEISLDTATWTVAFLGAIEERETKSKKPFCTFHLLDGAIAITANLWNTEKKDIYKVQEKSVISVQLYKKLYNGVETYEVKEYQAAPDDAKLEDYLLTAPIPSQDMMDEIKSILSKEISETELYPLVMEILDENADKLLYWAAAKTIHHNCYGGLLYHMLRMLKTAVILSRVYRFDKELLYSAVILHDIGKLQELDTDATGVAEYTVDMSHLVSSAASNVSDIYKDALSSSGVSSVKDSINTQWIFQKAASGPDAYSIQSYSKLSKMNSGGQEAQKTQKDLFDKATEANQNIYNNLNTDLTQKTQKELLKIVDTDSSVLFAGSDKQAAKNQLKQIKQATNASGKITRKVNAITDAASDSWNRLKNNVTAKSEDEIKEALQSNVEANKKDKWGLCGKKSITGFIN